jgi:hypothetical protein
MAITPYEFWYDKQEVRFLQQLVRGFSGFSYQVGGIAGAPPQTYLVPARIATTSRMVANLVANLSENTLLAVPMISIYQTGLRGRREDLQNPTYVDTKQVFERNITADGKYGPDRGNAYNVDRIMPMPFTMDVQVDIWTSNMNQKYMLIEQILPVIYPQFEIQSSDNALDWTALTICFVDDDFSFSSRTIPVGTTDEIDVMSIKLKMPIWLSAPAKVKRLGRIEEIVVTLNEGEFDPMSGLIGGTRLGQVVVSPNDACVLIEGSTITLYGAKHAQTLPNGSTPSWLTLLTEYGILRPTLSTLMLFIDDDIEGAFVLGSLQYGATANQLRWTIDASTLPANTLPAIDAVIDPHRMPAIQAPTLAIRTGTGLPSATNGLRYLLLNDISSGTTEWGNLSAMTNDIIQYNNGIWHVSFDSSEVVTPNYVLNTFTGRQLRWTGTTWAMSIDGYYQPGFWRVIL